ncbi:protein Hikeshi-like [Oscarella lobularis]|uniref:protein Hikeshi-like n=1 Tax=Oscarella lobularis TaxID=121494 RepID=UPI003313538C
MSLFGYVAAGRLIQTECEQIAENQFVFVVPDIDRVNHVVVFLTGVAALPDGFAAAIYIVRPDPQSPSPIIQYMGFIANQKPSAIFKLGRPKMQDASLNPFASGLLPQAGAQIAISIEPLDQVVQLSADQSAEATTKDVVSLVTSKLLENFSEYAASFAITQAQMIPAPNEMFIPVSALNRWVAKIERRLAEDPNFWRT